MQDTLSTFLSLCSKKPAADPMPVGGQQRKKEWFPRGSDMLTSTKFNDAKPMPIKRKSP